MIPPHSQVGLTYYPLRPCFIKAFTIMLTAALVLGLDYENPYEVKGVSGKGSLAG